MTKEQAINVLIQAARLAQSKGIFTLEDANAVLAAITTLSPKEEPKDKKDAKKD